MCIRDRYIPAIIMFTITCLVLSLFFVPVTRFPKENKLTNFYWVGFWAFLVIIASIAGAMNTLLLLGYNSRLAAEAIIAGVTASFVFFVVFAWFRLAAKVLTVGAAKGMAKFKN